MRTAFTRGTCAWNAFLRWGRENYQIRFAKDEQLEQLANLHPGYWWVLNTSKQSKKTSQKLLRQLAGPLWSPLVGSAPPDAKLLDLVFLKLSYKPHHQRVWWIFLGCHTLHQSCFSICLWNHGRVLQSLVLQTKYQGSISLLCKNSSESPTYPNSEQVYARKCLAHWNPTKRLTWTCWSAWAVKLRIPLKM